MPFYTYGPANSARQTDDQLGAHGVQKPKKKPAKTPDFDPDLIVKFSVISCFTRPNTPSKVLMDA
jgi:hypothetical protein